MASTTAGVAPCPFVPEGSCRLPVPGRQGSLWQRCSAGFPHGCIGPPRWSRRIVTAWSRPLGTDIAAAAAAHRELGPDYDAAVAEGLIERISDEIDKRVDARLGMSPRSSRSPAETEPVSRKMVAWARRCGWRGDRSGDHWHRGGGGRLVETRGSNL